MRTLGSVKLLFKDKGVYSNYSRVLHLNTSESEVSYLLGSNMYKRRCFMSRKRDLAVLEITSSVKRDFELNSGYFVSGEGEKEKSVFENDKTFAEYKCCDGCYIYSSKNMGKYFGIVCKVFSNGQTIITEDGISVRDASKSLVLMKAFSCEDNRDIAEQKIVKSLLDCPNDYAVLFNENLPEYKRLYNTAEIRICADKQSETNEKLLEDARYGKLSPQLAEKLWRFGRYLFISGTANNGLPFALYGIWPCGYARDFSHNVANENVQSIYWHADVGGLSELILPLINYYYDRMEGFRENARKLYGCKGIFVGTYTTPINCKIAWYVPVILHFCGVAGWLSSHFYRYYLYTGDEKTLTEKILPFMIETAEFYEEYHYLDENGKIVLYPAVSPENSPIEFYDKSVPHSMPTTKNPTVEIAILKELLQNLLELAKNRPELNKKVSIWQTMLDNIPEYSINEEGAIAEWMDKNIHDSYDHRHLSHIYPLFPGTEILDGNEQILLDAFERAVDLRELGSFCGWSLPHMSAIYSRLERGKASYDTLNMLAKVCLLDNFFTLGFDYRDMGITTCEIGDETFAPVQLDALMGFVNAMQEMFICVTPKLLRLLPACPKEFDIGEGVFRFATGIVKMKWNIKEKCCSGVITALRDTSIKIEKPFGQGSVFVDIKKGEEWIF